MSLDLTKPAIGSTDWGVDVNSNWNKLMAALNGTLPDDTDPQTLGYLTYEGQAAPDVSPAGDGRMYFDSTQKKFKVSEDAGAFVPIGLVEFAIFGDGSDGDLTLSSNVTLTRSMYYGNLTVPNGYTLDPAGCRIFCSGTLTNEGTISMNGGNASGGGVISGGCAGSAHSSVEFLAASGGACGGSGGASGSGSQGGTAGSITGDGGAGGVGGTGGSASGASGACGGAGGTLTRQKLRFMTPYLLYTSGSSISNLGPGTGGGGGGGGGASSGACGGGGGGGGAGGGILWIAAKKILQNPNNTSAVISAKGGNGGAGGTGGSGTAGGGGGGAGGGGGYIMLIYQTMTIGYGATPSVAGGSGGTGGSGSSGGSAGTGACAGATGTLLRFNMLKGVLE